MEKHTPNAPMAPQPVSSGDQEVVDPALVGYRGKTACQVANVTYRQLDYWARTGLIEPSVHNPSGSGHQRLYSFRDIMFLRVVKSLLQAGISLQQIRVAVSVLRGRGIKELSEIILLSDGATVYECTSDNEVIDLLKGGQGVFGIYIHEVRNQVEGTLSELAPVTETVHPQVVDELQARRLRRG